jgi:hypothetical protein
MARSKGINIKLTDRDIMEIRATKGYVTDAEAANLYCVTLSTVSRLRNKDEGELHKATKSNKRVAARRLKKPVEDVAPITEEMFNA